MKENVIFCFSATGNSLYAAEQIAKSIGNTKVYPMTEKYKTVLNEEFENIGFVYPVYFLGIPNAVKTFIESIDMSKNKNAYIFALSTSGGAPGNCLREPNAILEKKGLKLNYAIDLTALSNYIVLFKVPNNIELYMEKFDKIINTATEDIKNRKIKYFKRPNPIFRLYSESTLKKIKDKDRNFVVSDKCTSCSICEKVCPVDNIEMENGKPCYKHKCERCLSCVHYCPISAIEYKNMTKNKKRYHNKKYSWKDIANFYNK